MQDLYRQVVLDRYRSPRHRRALPDATHQAHTHNPLCGDELTVYARVDGATLAEAGFEARGCSISQASADLMIDAVAGRALDEVHSLTAAFRNLLEDEAGEPRAELGEARTLAEVRRYPVRVKCALLAWETLEAALASSSAAAAGESA